MEKVIKDGRVAVIYSPGFGAGWYTWNQHYVECLFHPTIVNLVLAGKHKEITEELCKSLFGSDFFDGGSDDLAIEWLPAGSKFYVEEYDGLETIITIDDLILEA